MRYSQYFIPTLRDVPADAEVPSQIFALRGGYVKKIAAGIYDYLPLGLRVIRKIENIIREELNKKGAIEILMPSMVPVELWQESGRWYAYGKELLRIKDRADREFCYGPTHEEVIVDMVRNNIQSYKQLPVNLYQIQAKFRDEIRPRFGLMRAREFTMKDAYSFHSNTESLDKTYQDMFEAYSNIFKRCGLKFRVVRADSGNIGGNASQEFMITADTGEDAILYCDHCDYSANIEKATTIIKNIDSEPAKKMELVNTPDKKSIEEVAKFLKVPDYKTMKAVFYRFLKGDKLGFAMVFVRGDYEINETKVKNILDATTIELAKPEETSEYWGCENGFIGPNKPSKKKTDYQVVELFDNSLTNAKNMVCGANQKDKHLLNFNPARDLSRFEDIVFVDLNMTREGDDCPECHKGKLKKERGIEVGHIFKLGTKYSKAMNASYLDEKGLEQNFIMGCYGIGVGRTAMAAIEQAHDEHGPLWPVQIAPFEVILITANMETPEQVTAAEKLYIELQNKNIEVLFDDRKDRIGVKFNDADLIGAPLRIIIGKKIAEGIIELNYRTGNKVDITFKGAAELIADILKKL
ncbi:MAG: proline--tRNA ligase [Candidatus Margulisbacteria bacterium]|nr:proline--tRNA ligase [Candidatus Margulisiibacteriota bacterium]